jgi:hypothetical protein
MKIRTLFALGVSLSFAAALSAQTKSSGTIQCGKPDPMNVIEVGDKPGHVFAISKVSCTWTKPMQLGDTATKDGGSVGFGEIRGARSTDTGAHWSSMSNGDKIFVSFHGASTYDKDGHPLTSNGHWSYTGGTGKMKGITGKGTFAGKGSPDGSMTYDIEGYYKLAAK